MMTQRVAKPLRQQLIVLFLFLGSAQAVFAQSLSCKLIPQLVLAFLKFHVTVRTLTPTLKKDAADNYIEMLDPSKTLFLASDVKDMRQKLIDTFDTMKSNNCAALETIHTVALQRAQESEAFARTFLGPKYQLDIKTQLQLDVKKRDYPKTAADRNELLKKYIHFQIFNYLNTDIKIDEARDRLVHRYELITKRFKERKPEDLLSMFTDAFATAMDPHSNFMSKDHNEDFQIDMGLRLYGIGASLSSQDGITTVEELIRGGAAEKSGLVKPKDKIVGVAQGSGEFVDVVDKELRDVVRLIRGPENTPVRLKVVRKDDNGNNQKVDIPLTRSEVKLEDQAAKITYEKRSLGNKEITIGVLDFPSFYGDQKRSSFEDIKKILVEAKAKKIDGLIVNLSRNGGGLLEDAYKIGGLFIKKGPIVATRNSNNEVSILADDDESIYYSGPLVLLTSRASASASEILSGALKDYHRALIVGSDHTFGKGTVQTVIPLNAEIGALKVTTGMFFIPGGQSTQHQGVVGDVLVPSLLNNEKVGEKVLDHSLPPKTIAEFLGKNANSQSPEERWVPISATEVKTLAGRSKLRVDQNAKFKELKKDIAEAKKSDGVVKLVELDTKVKEDKKKHKDDEKKSLVERVREADAPIIGEAINVVTDLIALRSGSANLPALAVKAVPSVPKN